ncbi:MAG: hypothetical protein E7616_09830 [Ruminococcaceae bacterium]|nr:hypothetical protein [Oscillospiraceae bacterium]
MTKTEFLELCRNSNISTKTIHFENAVADGYYVLKNYHRWEVFFRERGTDCECMGFPSESDALNYLADKLICD